MFRTSYAASGAGRAAVVAASVALSLLVRPVAASAGELGVKVEPGVAFPLTRPQSDRFDPGGGGAAKLLYGLGRYLDVTAGVSSVVLPRSSGSLSSGTATAWGYGGGLRLKRPHDARSLHGLSPWLDGDALYVRTGPLDRVGFAAALGVALPVGGARNLWVGPYVRYQQILGRGDGAVDGRDAKVLLGGLSFELGRGPTSRAVAQAAPAAAPAVAAATPARAAMPDGDADGTLDGDDLCPDVAGPTSNRGCPRYEKVIVKPDKLELKDKIQFAWNSPRIDPASHPALDETVKALQDNRGFRVQIEGHSSSEGGDGHNQTLSEARAQAVLDYLASHGVARERLASTGFSSSVPLDSNATAAGREANRRVEFVVHLVILKSGSGQ